MREIELLGLSSIPLVIFISLFMGAVLTIQTAINLDDPFIPDLFIGVAVREGIVLEFSPTIVSLILAGKVGSNISSSLGAMRVTEQMDALQVMGINPAGYLVLPKIVACLLFFPVLIVFSIFMGLLGGYLAGDWLQMVNPDHFLMGYFDEFNPFFVVYALTKTVFLPLSSAPSRPGTDSMSRAERSKSARPVPRRWLPCRSPSSYSTTSSLT